MTSHKKASYELREEEKLLKFLSETGIDPTEGVSNELLDRFLTTERSRIQFATFFDETITVNDNDGRKGESRVAVFLHPRFRDMTNCKSDQHRIKILLEGQMPLELDGQKIIMESGDICFIAPGVEFSRPTLDQNTLLLNIILEDHPSNVFRQLFSTKNPISVFFKLTEIPELRIPYLLCRTGGDPEVQDVLNMIYDYKAEREREHSGERIAELMVEQLLLMLIERHIEDFSDLWKMDTQRQDVRNILDYIYENARTLTLPALAQYFNYSDAYMSRFIKRNTGLSFSELHRNVRLDMALKLLHDTELPISNIIAEVGYSGKAHFYRVFQSKFGLTPAEMRAKFRPGSV